MHFFAFEISPPHPQWIPHPQSHSHSWLERAGVEISLKEISNGWQFSLLFCAIDVDLINLENGSFFIQSQSPFTIVDAQIILCFKNCILLTFKLMQSDWNIPILRPPKFIIYRTYVYRHFIKQYWLGRLLERIKDCKRRIECSTICIFRMENPQWCKSEFGKEDWLMAMAGPVKKGQKLIVTLAPTGDPARGHILGKTLAWKINQFCIFFGSILRGFWACQFYCKSFISVCSF